MLGLMARRRNDFTDREVQSLINSGVNAFQRLSARMQLIVVILLIVGGIIAAGFYVRSQHRQGAFPQTSGTAAVHTNNLLLGNPSNATSDASNRDNYLMIKPYFALSYNNSEGTPNWVSWEVSMADLGSAARKTDFDPDSSPPVGFKVVMQRDYNGSGFDRGHLCPHGDRTGNLEMSYATFVMTNIIPQAPNLNRKAWDQFEVYCRELVRGGERVYIIAGPAGRRGRGSAGWRDSLAGGKVMVPAECWKVVVAVPANGGDDDLAKINGGTRVIAVDMPNDQEQVGEIWAGFRVSPAQVERKTGYHFFTQLRSDVAQALETKVDQTFIPPPRPLMHAAE